MWVTEYPKQVEADFLAFYHIFDISDHPGLTGVRFLQLAGCLPLYEGAVRRQIELDFAPEADEQPVEVYQAPAPEPPKQTISMNEFMAQRSGVPADLAGLGDLMEYGKG